MSLSEGQFMSSWLLDMVTSNTQDFLVKLVAILWSIWFFRNKKVWEGRLVTAQVVVAWGITRISEWSL